MDQRIGAQLYTIRDFCQTKEDLDASFAKLQKIGYKQVQVSGIGPISGPDVKAACDKYGLEVSCTHRSLQSFEEDFENEVAFHKAIGCDIAGLGAMPREYWNGENIMEFVDRMNNINDAFAKEGITFAYHNHAFEFEKNADGKFAMDYLLEHGKFSFIVDTYWLAYAGINPAKFIKNLGERAVAIHFKDLAIIDNAIVMAEITYGNLDWDEIIAASKAAGARFALVEQDTCRRDPFESLKMSYDALVKKGFI